MVNKNWARVGGIFRESKQVSRYNNFVSFALTQHLCGPTNCKGMIISWIKSRKNLCTPKYALWPNKLRASVMEKRLISFFLPSLTSKTRKRYVPLRLVCVFLIHGKQMHSFSWLMTSWWWSVFLTRSLKTHYPFLLLAWKLKIMLGIFEVPINTIILAKKGLYAKFPFRFQIIQHGSYNKWTYKVFIIDGIHYFYEKQMNDEWWRDVKE